MLVCSSASRFCPRRTLYQTWICRGSASPPSRFCTIMNAFLIFCTVEIVLVHFYSSSDTHFYACTLRSLIVGHAVVAPCSAEFRCPFFCFDSQYTPQWPGSRCYGKGQTTVQTAAAQGEAAQRNCQSSSRGSSRRSFASSHCQVGVQLGHWGSIRTNSHFRSNRSMSPLGITTLKTPS